ncbi:response regulator transcription factor [Agrococcus sp. ARC_14]|uniref:response regulator transcription factor n=1 Tax=Agrococcus sp. ARC_14 TaxID=2919927 RepID=UPI001F0570F8|nr:response regulator transcription factor [Agrococcus sp. ARC_14]MCH1882546.1 response regulator transcription factor [Agrococcus sp. ARC_14]
MTIRIAVVDDQSLVRLGFRMVLEAEEGLEVVGEASDGAEAVALAARGGVDVVLMDVRMPGLDGIAATERISAAASPPKVLVLTTFDLDEYAYAALRAGASGFLLKDVRPAELIAAIRAVHAGDAALAPAVTRRMLERFTSSVPSTRDDTVLEVLTPREREFLIAIAEGCTNDELAARFVLSASTVKTHVGRLLRKLDARDRVQLVILAYELGIVGR